MFGLFNRRSYLGADLEDWLLETFGWLMTHLGGMATLGQRPLVLPTKDFFPPTELTGEARGAYVFEKVRGYMGLADAPIDLQMVEARRGGQRVDELLVLQPQGGAAAGTFEVIDNRALISYADDLIPDTRRLIAVFAHELAHYHLATIHAGLPGGNDLHELATDLTVAYAGFGVFGAGAAFGFEQHLSTYSQGWRFQRIGYLSREGWAFAIALFLALSDRQGAAAGYLAPHVEGLVKKADAYLAKNPERLAPLRAIA